MTAAQCKAARRRARIKRKKSVGLKEAFSAKSEKKGKSK